MEECLFKRNFVKINNNLFFSVMLLFELYKGKEFIVEEIIEIFEGLNLKIVMNFVVI